MFCENGATPRELTHGRVVIGHQETDEEDGQDEEDDQSVNDTLDSFGDVAARVDGFGSAVGDEVRATNGEGGSVEDTPDRKEAASCAIEILRVKSARVPPVLEADDLSLRIASADDDETEEEEADDEEDLHDRGAELDFTEILDSQAVQEEYNDQG